jgi:hypothetical protein
LWHMRTRGVLKGRAHVATSCFAEMQSMIMSHVFTAACRWQRVAETAPHAPEGRDPRYVTSFERRADHRGGRCENGAGQRIFSTLQPLLRPHVARVMVHVAHTAVWSALVVSTKLVAPVFSW